ncbi:toll/interleukin-1 receptor domain-containing protein [Streptomyces sp. NPDC014733]|uniref:toll/interleukin-1 receptor domain-containing protein n=1 Tax=Streptomyces sp. NPDC014733 TaxID=3364885 RepID=UPI0036FE1DEB
MPDVFINYRTGDEEATATLLDRELSRRFGSERIFRASKSIAAGRNFPQALLTAVRRCHVLLAVIGPRWTEARPADGGAPGTPGDWTQRELQEALGAATTVVPVLVGPVARLRRTELPEALAALADLQYRRLHHRTADADLRRIADDLAALVPSLAAVDRFRAGERAHHTGPAPLPAELPWQERWVDPVRLESARPDHPFLFSATVRWRPARTDASPRDPGLADLAVSTVVSRARALVAGENPEHRETALLLLRGELGCPYTDPAARITVRADDTDLNLDEADRARLAELSRLRKEAGARELHRLLERSRHPHPDDAAAEHAVRLVDALGLAPGSPERAAYAKRLARATAAVGRTAAAAQIRQHLAACRCTSPAE